MGFLQELLFIITPTKILELVGFDQENIFFSEMCFFSNTCVSFYDLDVYWKTITTTYLFLDYNFRRQEVLILSSVYSNNKCDLFETNFK